MIEITATQFQLLTMVVNLATRGIINYEKARQRAEKILNMTDEQLSITIKNVELESDLLMKELDEI